MRCALAVALVHAIASAHAEELPHVTFDASALRRTANGLVDVSRFAEGMPAPVGLHEVELRRNGQALGRERVRFTAGPTRAVSIPCIDVALLSRLDLAPDAVATRVPATPDACAPIESLVPGASARYDAAELALALDIPHAALAVRAEDAIDPAQWDAGLDALRVDYNLAFGRESRPGETTLRTGLRLALGANVGAWRLRHRTTHAWQTDRAVRRDTLGTTPSTDVPALGAQLQLGDFHTSGVLFDAVGVRGVLLESDDRMLPPSLARYAPVVRGVAATRARVQVRQGGQLLAETFVAPGAFALRDVQPLGYGGALDVRVQEADGTVQAFSVPYAAIPGLLRHGQARFGVVAGRVDGARDNAAHPFMQGTFQRGLLDRLTLQVGAQLAPDYLHVLGGVAMSTLVGAFSLDRTHSRTARQSGTLHGASMRLAYTGQVPATNTTIDVAAWRYGNHAFRTVHDALRERDAARTGAPLPDADARERSRIDLSLQQRVGRDGNSLFATLTLGDDHASRTRTSAQLAYASRIGRGSVHASLARTLQATPAAHDARASIVFSMPLSNARARHALQAQWRDGGRSHTTGIGATGRLSATGATGYALGLSNTQRDGASTIAHHASLTQATRAGVFGLGASATEGSRQQSATADGALVLHRHGLTPGPPLGETIALVRARDGSGARVAGNAHIRLDRRGHALVPALAAYRASQVGVDPMEAAPDVHFAWTETRVVPRAGAIVDVVLPTTRARTEWLRPVRDDGAQLPFGTDLTDAAGTSLGTIDREGTVLVRIAADTTAIEARWRDGEPMRCRITVSEPTAAASTAAASTPRPIPCQEATPD